MNALIGNVVLKVRMWWYLRKSKIFKNNSVGHWFNTLVSSPRIFVDSGMISHSARQSMRGGGKTVTRLKTFNYKTKHPTQLAIGINNMNWQCTFPQNSYIAVLISNLPFGHNRWCELWISVHEVPKRLQLFQEPTQLFTSKLARHLHKYHGSITLFLSYDGIAKCQWDQINPKRRKMETYWVKWFSCGSHEYNSIWNVRRNLIAIRRIRCLWFTRNYYPSATISAKSS